MMSAGARTEPGGYTGAGKEKIHHTERGIIKEIASGSSEWAPVADRGDECDGGNFRSPMNVRRTRWRAQIRKPGLRGRCGRIGMRR